MAIFPCIHTDSCVQEGDKFCIDASHSYVTPDEGDITMVEIQAEPLGTFYDVTSEDLKLCWAYDLDGIKTITVRVSTATDSQTSSVDVEVKTAEEDCLFAKDNDLIVYEPEILKFLDCDRCSFIYIHRQVKECILSCLLKLLAKNKCEPKLDEEALKASHDIRKWASYWALEMIYSGASNKPDDAYAFKAKQYESMKIAAQSSFSFDRNGNGTIEASESVGWTKCLVRR